MRVFSMERGQILFEYGDGGEDVFFLLSGRLVGQVMSESGREVTFTELRAGTHFGELAALDNAPRSLTVSATQPSRVGRLSGAQFRALLMDEPMIGLNLARELGQRTRALNEQMFGLAVHDVETRVRTLLLRLGQEAGQIFEGGVLEPAPTHESMATRVCANREAVSRAISKLNKQGIVEAGRQRVVFRDIERLVSGPLD
jgi:CRP-like cAMP-binding protein